MLCAIGASSLDPIIPFSCSRGKSLGWTKITTRVRVCTGSGGKTSPAAISPDMWSNILMQLDKLCTSSILRYVESRSSNWVSRKRSSMLVNRYESLLNYFAARQLQLFFVLCEQVTKTKLGWALTAFTTSLSYCLHEGETAHGWFVATQITLMYPYVTSSCLRDMNMIFLSFLHLWSACVYKHGMRFL